MWQWLVSALDWLGRIRMAQAIFAAFPVGAVTSAVLASFNSPLAIFKSALIGGGATSLAAAVLVWLGRSAIPRSAFGTLSFKIALQEQLEVLLGDQAGSIEFCTLKVRNTSGHDLKQCCMVRMEELSVADRFGIKLPLTLRTERQISQDQTGRFNLSKGESKLVPVLWTSKLRPKEWFTSDENRQQFSFPAGNVKLKLAVYGGKNNVAGIISITVGKELKPTCRLQTVRL